MKNPLVHLYLITACVMISQVLPAQQPDPEKILDQVRQKFLAVKDYEASVTIKVDVDFVKIPLKKGTVWFAQPDQVKVKTEGFSLLPKKGMNFSPNQLLTGDYFAILSGEEKIGNHSTWVIKIIPKNDSGDILISKIWVDKERMVIRKLESTTRSQGTFEMFFEFPVTTGKYDLPEQIIFRFDLRRNEIPVGLSGDFNAQAENKGKKNANTSGTVTIRYMEYVVNQGKGLIPFKKKNPNP